MNIIAICGSPRKGNTEFILKKLLIKAEEFGAKTELILLREKRIEFCNGCLECDRTGKCVLRDVMQEMYMRLEENDVIIFGSPVYFENVSGMMKNFMDRLVPYCTNKKLIGKKMIVIGVGETGSEMANKVVDKFNALAESLGLVPFGDMYFRAKEANDIEKDPSSSEKIESFCKSIIG